MRRSKGSRARRERDERRLWPKFYPPECPPESARHRNLLVFHLVKSEDFSHDEDFVPLALRHPNDPRVGKLRCQCCGLSVFTEREDVEAVRRRLPPLRSTLVAKGELKPGHGVVLRTGGRSHHTWWVPVSVDPRAVFVCVECQEGCEG